MRDLTGVQGVEAQLRPDGFEEDSCGVLVILDSPWLQTPFEHQVATESINQLVGRASDRRGGLRDTSLRTQEPDKGPTREGAVGCRATSSEAIRRELGEHVSV